MSPKRGVASQERALWSFYAKLTLFVAGLFSLVGILFLSGSHALNAQACANAISCIKDLSGKPESSTAGVYMGRAIHAPQTAFLATNPNNGVLGITSNPNKHIYVDLNTQHLYAFDGNDLIFSFPISSGKYFPTPTGTFSIWIKLRATRMIGGNKVLGTYYDLPNVPYTMYFYNDQVPKTKGFSLHGAYWHNNFGHPMSHGCVNISVDNAKLLYDWADPTTTGDSTPATTDSPGTQVTIFGTAPKD